MAEFFDEIFLFLTTSGVRIVGAIVLVIVGLVVVKKIDKLLKKKMLPEVDPNAKTFLLGFANVTAKVLLVVTAAAMIGVPMTNIVAVLGSCGLALGLALQGSLSNLAGGLMILIFKPFKIGDYIIAEGSEGTVEDINMLYTVIVTLENHTVTLPNGSLSNSVITDVSQRGTRRLDFEIGIAYESDIEAARGALLALAEANERVLEEPKPVVNITSYDDSSVTMLVRVYVKHEDYWEVHFALRNGAKVALDEAGVTIPFPQVDVHMK